MKEVIDFNNIQHQHTLRNYIKQREKKRFPISEDQAAFVASSSPRQRLSAKPQQQQWLIFPQCPLSARAQSGEVTTIVPITKPSKPIN